MALAWPAAAEVLVEAELPEVVVVGSRMSSPDAADRADVQRITPEAIANSSARQLSDLLRASPLNSAGSVDDKNTNSYSGATANVALRGLSPDYTLVLLNGRRVANYPFAEGQTRTFADLNSLPFSAVRSLAIQGDGGSAVYGADAVAGIVSLNTLDTLSPRRLALSSGRSEHGGAGDSRGEFHLAFGDDARFAVGGFAYRRNQLMLRDRAFSASADQTSWGGNDYRSGYSAPGSWRTPGSAWQPFPDCPAERARGGRCLYNSNETMQAVPATERHGAWSASQVPLAGRHEWFSEAFVVSSHTENMLPPTAVPVFVLPAGDPRIPVWMPAGQDVSVRYRLTAAPDRLDIYDTTAYRVLSGLRGPFAQLPAEYELAAGQSESRVDNPSTNFLHLGRFRQALNDGSFNPFEAPGAETQRAWVTDTWRTGRSSLSFADFSLKAPQNRRRAPVDWVLGTEWVRERMSNHVDENILSGMIGFGGGDEFSAGRQRVAVFGEIGLAPDPASYLRAALRTDRYSDFGFVTNPQLRYTRFLGDALQLSAGYGHAFKAPTFPQLASRGFTRYLNYYDPRRCPVTRASSDCGGGTVETVLTGNAALQPEKSRSMNLALDWQLPHANTLIGVAYWQLLLRNRILDQVQNAIDAEGASGVTIERETASAEDQARGIPGALSRIQAPYANDASVVRYRGIDLRTRSRFAALGWSHEVGMLISRPVGRRGDAGVPSLRAELGYTLRRGDWRTGLSLHHIGGYRLSSTSPASGDVLRVKASQTADAFVARKLSPEMTARLVIRNLFDRVPPHADFVTGYDSGFADPIGRAIWLHVELRS